MRKTNLNKHINILIMLGLGAVCMNPLAGDEPVVDADLPEAVSLNGEWAFKLLPDEATANTYEHFYEEDFDCTGFDKIKVPSNWALEGFEDPRYVNGSTAEGFYCRTFTVPESVRDLRAILHFGGVWVSAEVWLNGENLGRHDSGFTAFGFDISNELKAGEENRISVRVRQQIPAALFKFDANDDWGLAGIFRDVWIEFTPKHLFIDTVEVVTDLDEAFENADLKLRVFVARNERDHYIAPSAPFDVRATLIHPSGQEEQVLTKEITVAGGHNGRDTHLVMKVHNPLTWTAETPVLYQLKVEIVRNGVTVHQWKDSIGFREVSTDGGVFRINGQIVKLRGVASHDLQPDTGRATTREQWLRDIQLMKDANINAVRMAHYPHAEGFIRLCDEYGLYVLDEIPLGFGGDRMGNPIFASGMFLRIHETIQRDRNRPSVIVWDFGNEDGLTYLHTVGLRTIKGLDPTRPVLLPFRAEPELPPEVDVLAPHYWFADAYDQLAASAVRPVISTEYTHALGTEGLGELEDRWTALTRHPAGAGAMIWLWADQGLLRQVEGRPVFDPMKEKASYTREGGELVRHSDAGAGAIYDAHGNYGTDGIVNPDRSLTRDYLEVKAVYAPVKILVDSLDLTHEQEKLEIPIYNGFDFLDLESVGFSWKLFHDDKVIDSGNANLKAGPHERANLDVSSDLIDGDGEFYVHIEIRRSDDSLMTTRSVRLRRAEPAFRKKAEEFPLKVLDRTDQATILVGKFEYSFDKKSGEIRSIRKSGEAYAGNSNLIVWRPSTFNERNRYDRRENQHDWDTFMQGLEATLLEWNLESVKDRVVIHTKSLYQEDEMNKVTVSYTYTVKSNGELEVAMEVLPEMDIPELPEIGLVLDLPGSMNSLSWLGEGPMASVPGKTAATNFGWWNASLDSPLSNGTKSGLSWGQLNYADETQLRILYPEGIRLEQKSEGNQLRILTHVGGAWTKNGPPERDAWHLSLGSGKPFRGSFCLQFRDQM